VLRLSFKGRPSWIEVIQADGRVLWAGMNEADTERLLIGQPPLRLLIGNASSVSVEYRGRAVDLKPHIRADDLARLTVE
jgi:cytoskeleton protein RodZ